MIGFYIIFSSELYEKEQERYFQGVFWNWLDCGFSFDCGWDICSGAVWKLY